MSSSDRFCFSTSSSMMASMDGGQRPLFAFAFFLLFVAGSYESPLPPQVYWNSVLPNTPMPSAIRDLVYPGASDEKAAVSIGWGGIHVIAGKPGRRGGTTVDIGKGGIGVNVGGSGGTHVGVGGGGVGVNAGGGGRGTHVGVGGGGVGVNVGGRGGSGRTHVGVGRGGVGVNVGGRGGGGGTHVGVGGGGVGVNVGGRGGGGGTHVGVGGGGVGVNVGGRGGGGGTHVGVGGGGVGVNVGGRGGTHVGVGGGGVYVGTPAKRKPVSVHVGSPFNYQYAASETQLHDDPSVALFFLEKDLRPGTNMTLHFTPTTTAAAAGAGFLPREAADSIPFSSSALPEILSRFSIRPTSPDAETVASALRECESPAMAGEAKTCATSLESMIDFATASLHTKDVLALSTEVEGQKKGTSGGAPKQRYTVGHVRRVDGGEEAVACHAVEYAYAVFLCHASRGSKVYAVPLAGEEEDGGGVEAVAVCHTDTKGWNPKHLAFQVLKVGPGGAPVCHFLPQDHVVWTPKK